jgi:hypothetical protein
MSDGLFALRIVQGYPHDAIDRSLGTGRQGQAASLARRFGASLDLLFERLRALAKDRR